MLSGIEKQLFLKLFNRGGFVLDFSTPQFDEFTRMSVGVALCERYGLSKGASLEAYIAEADDEHAAKLLFDLLEYYEASYGPEFDEGQASDFNPAVHTRGQMGRYQKCAEIRNRELAFGRGSELPAQAAAGEADSDAAVRGEVRAVSAFISHSSADSKLVMELKAELARYGFACIVAHEDIRVSVDWGLELERLLSSCDVLLYLATHDANQSAWCQQEVGWALGRGIPVVSLKVSDDPTAFLGRIQALLYGDAPMAQVAQMVVGSLLRDERVHEPLVDALLHALGESRSYDESNAIAECLVGAEWISQRQEQWLEQIIEDNAQVRNANWGKLPERLHKLQVR